MSSSRVGGRAEADARVTTERRAPFEDVPLVVSPLWPEGDRAEDPDAGWGDDEAESSRVRCGGGPNVEVLEPSVVPPTGSVPTLPVPSADTSSGAPSFGTGPLVVVPGWLTQSGTGTDSRAQP